MNTIRYKFPLVGRLFVLLCAVTVTSQALWAQSVADSLDTRVIDLWPRWQIEPKFDFSWVAQDPMPKPVPNLAALNSSVVAERVEEARRMVVISQHQEFQGGEEALIVLLEKLKTPTKNRMELLAYLSGAMALGSADIAEQIWTAAQTDLTAQLAVEGWLIEIRSDLALYKWRKRLQDATEQNESYLIAIEGVGAVGSESDVPAIQEVVRSSTSYLTTRLTASTALGQLASDGLESFAQLLLESDLPMRELLAAKVLAGHTSSEAGQICERILASEAEVSHGPAFRVLASVDAERARDAAKNGLLKHPESTVRQLAVEHLANLDDADSLRALGFSLRDSNPETRRTARAALQRAYVTHDSVQQFVREAIGFYLQGDFEFGAEQAIVLAASLEMKQFCPRLIDLLSHPSEGVHVRAAWALQELVDDVNILGRLMPIAREITSELEPGDQYIKDSRVTMLAMLFGAFGRNAYMPASEMLLKYVPKNEHIMRDESRAAAIWALGRIWADRGNAGLAKQLAKRMTDNNPDDPENKIVKYTSALALGMLRDPGSVRRLRSAVADEGIPAPLGYAATWAIEQYDAAE
ncbi:MAG: hypothetical protein Aurels2KO_14250 [Aureliella sp.]